MGGIGWYLIGFLMFIVWIYGIKTYIRYRKKKDMESGYMLDRKTKKNLK